MTGASSELKRILNVLKNFTNLDQLTPIGTTLLIGLLQLRGGSGSPVAVLALLPQPRYSSSHQLR